MRWCKLSYQLRLTYPPTNNLGRRMSLHHGVQRVAASTGSSQSGGPQQIPRSRVSGALGGQTRPRGTCGESMPCHAMPCGRCTRFACMHACSLSGVRSRREREREGSGGGCRVAVTLYLCWVAQYWAANQRASLRAFLSFAFPPSQPSERLYLFFLCFSSLLPCRGLMLWREVLLLRSAGDCCWG